MIATVAGLLRVIWSQKKGGGKRKKEEARTVNFVMDIKSFSDASDDPREPTHACGTPLTTRLIKRKEKGKRDKLADVEFVGES